MKGRVGRRGPGWVGGLVEGLVARLIPEPQRESVLGDLLEEGLRPGSAAHAGALLGVVLHVHAEAWRDEGARLGALLTLVLAFSLWWVAAAADPATGDVVALYRDPLSRAALSFWSAPHLPAALAAGLVIGTAPWIGPVGGPARGHVVLVLAVVACSAAPEDGGLLPFLLVMGAAWLGDAAREDPAPDSATRSV